MNRVSLNAEPAPCDWGRVLFLFSALFNPKN